MDRGRRGTIASHRSGLRPDSLTRPSRIPPGTHFSQRIIRAVPFVWYHASPVRAGWLGGEGAGWPEKNGRGAPPGAGWVSCAAGVRGPGLPGWGANESRRDRRGRFHGVAPGRSATGRQAGRHRRGQRRPVLSPGGQGGRSGRGGAEPAAPAGRDRDRAVGATMLYFHPWEFDPDQPRLPLGRLGGFRTYVGIRHSQGRLERLMAGRRFLRAGDLAASLCGHLDSLPRFRPGPCAGDDGLAF